MTVDKNLFLYNLSIVSIMKNEGPYAKEWIDYHLLAGVEHFYIYDNESPDNLKEVLQPYIDAGIVTYTFYPGKFRLMESFNDAVHKFRFFSRYMAFIDGDEFIFPQNNKTIVEVADEIFNNNPNAGGLVMNWYIFGSNNLESADYSKGVLERFTRRAHSDWCPPLSWAPGKRGGNATIKTLANPRKVRYFPLSHCAVYFEDTQAINSEGTPIVGFSSYPVKPEKIVVNHYNTKSKEEYLQKIKRGNAEFQESQYNLECFKENDKNDVFDDSILKYRAYRMSVGGGIIPPVNYQKCYTALLQNLSPTFSKYVPPEIFAGKMETFLTCRKLAEHLREKILDETAGNFFEEAALNAIHKTLSTNVTVPDLRLLLDELPNLFLLDYPVVDDIRRACINVIPQLMNLFRVNNVWKEFTELEYLLNMLKVLDSYESA